MGFGLVWFGVGAVQHWDCIGVFFCILQDRIDTNRLLRFFLSWFDELITSGKAMCYSFNRGSTDWLYKLVTTLLKKVLIAKSCGLIFSPTHASQ